MNQLTTNVPAAANKLQHDIVSGSWVTRVTDGQQRRFSVFVLCLGEPAELGGKGALSMRDVVRYGMWNTGRVALLPFGAAMRLPRYYTATGVKFPVKSA